MRRLSLLPLVVAWAWPAVCACAALAACGGRHPAPAEPAPPAPPPAAEVRDEPCAALPGDHVIFSVIVDGLDAGREVRTDHLVDGPTGKERHILSHAVIRMKMGLARFESRETRSERTAAATGSLVTASHVAIDQVNQRAAVAERQGDGFLRRTSADVGNGASKKDEESPLALRGDEVIGLGLLDVLRAAALGKQSPTVVPYYDPLLAAPTELSVQPPTAGKVETNGLEIEGTWVEVRQAEKDKVVMRAFFDKGGTLWVEEYPERHQVRQRLTGPLTLPSETSELLVGLRSDAYVADLSAATRATYRLRATPDRFDTLQLLDAPLNQTLKRTAPDELILEVKAGAPDGAEPPRSEDLSDSPYVMPHAKPIGEALRYLRSAGRRGHLSLERSYNATPVVARVALLPDPKRFWADPTRVAALIMHYVSALLPDKRHTFSMADAVTTLQRGAGDCTEHAVLFASLMRAHGIPTRLVTGMYLTRGGFWGYHMWNSYWDGHAWQPIDPATMTFRPGALHVALGRGASSFLEVRDHLAEFMWRTFSGVTFDLIEATNEGEILSLARPRNHDQNLPETALFNAVVLSERGDHASAIALLDENIPAERRSLAVKLMRLTLLVRSGAHQEALHGIAALRSETSATENTDLLDDFELECLIAMGRFDEAEKIHSRIARRSAGAPARRVLAEAKLLFGRSEEDRAVALLESAVQSSPDDVALLTALARLVAESRSAAAAEKLPRALAAAEAVAELTRYADPEAIAVLSSVLVRLDRVVEASWLLDHALVLAPVEPALLRQRGALAEERRCRDQAPAPSPAIAPPVSGP